MSDPFTDKAYKLYGVNAFIAAFHSYALQYDKEVLPISRKDEAVHVSLIIILYKVDLCDLEIL